MKKFKHSGFQVEYVSYIKDGCGLFGSQTMEESTAGFSWTKSRDAKYPAIW